MEQGCGITIYPSFCEQFERLAQNFYSQYRLALECPSVEKSYDYLDSPELFVQQMKVDNLKETSAICAIVFESLAIEAYVNFWGASILGDEIFFSKYEPQKNSAASGSAKTHLKSTLEKMKYICKTEFDKPYPTNGSHYSRLKNLFLKRDKLVHNKPRGYLIELAPFNYDSPELAFADYTDVLNQINFIYDGIDDELKLYEEVKSNLEICSGKLDPSKQQFLNSAKQIATQIDAMVNMSFLNDTKKEQET